jgi:TolB protein
MTACGTGIICKARIATAAWAALAILGTGFDVASVNAQSETQETLQDKAPGKYELLFGKLDTSKDQTLQLDEYLKHKPAAPAVAKRDFKLFDFDRSGKLSLNEFITIPAITPLHERGSLPDPLDAYVDHAVNAMDDSFDTWDEHPERQIQAWTFVQLFICTFGSRTTRPDVKEADENGDGKVNRHEARRFLEIQFGFRRTDGTLLRSPDGRVCNLALFREIDANDDDFIDKAEIELRATIDNQFGRIVVQGDTDKDDRISFKEWSSLPSRGQLSPVNDFRRMDTNLDARLDQGELLHDVPAWQKTMSANVFPGFDTDGDGLLSLGEYRMTMQANPSVRWHMPVADADGDHELTFAEFKFDTSNYLLLRWLYYHRLDVNGDGVLTLDEYQFQTKTPDEFFIVNSDGTGWRSLFRFKTHFACGSPAVSPDGKQLAFDAWSIKPRTSPTLFTLELGKTEPRRIGSGSMPSWSPDGKRFASSHSGIRIIGTDGWNKVAIRENGWGAQWSPDGKTIAFTEGFMVKSYDVESKKFRTILRSHDYKQILWNMTWSPDSRILCLKGQKADGTQDVVTLDTSSEKPTPKVHHSTKSNINADFAWHPDGDRIVFGMHCPERKHTQIYEFDPNRDEPPTLFPGQDETRNNTDVSWTPDGRQLIVVSGDF